MIGKSLPTTKRARAKDWERYVTLRNSTDNPKSLQLYRNASSECCWTQDCIKILSPSPRLVELSAKASEDDHQKYHHLSYVLMVEYAGVKVLLGGDASIEAWEEILNECGKDALKAHMFLAPHHGSKNNIHKDAFEAIAPEYVFVSVVEGEDYDYNYYSELAKKKVLSTKYYGTMNVKIHDDANYLPIYVEKNEGK
jgi:competence protein ComEC